MKSKWFLLLVLALSGCSEAPQEGSPAAAADSGEQAVSGFQSGVQLEHFDTALQAGDDFYRFVNGRWLQDTVIPADKSNYGAFTMLGDQSQENLRQIIDEAAASSAGEGSDSQKVGGFYNSFMGLQRIEELGNTPMSAAFAELQAVSSKARLLVYSAELNWVGVQMPIGFYINNDEKQSDQYITYLTQSGLGLPDRDWYLSEDDQSHIEARQAYREYIGTILGLAGYARAPQATDSVMAIERAIAQAHWDRVRNRQAELTYNKRTLEELAVMAPELDWSALLSALGVNESVFIVNQPDYLQALGDIWSEHSLQQWKDYYAFKTLDAFASYLSDDFVQAQFNFEGRTLSGLEELEPRWKRGVDAVDRALGELVGRLYVERFFQEESKQRMDQLIENLRAAFRAGIDELEWMTPATKAKAQQKLASFNTKIGYPDKWKDYSGLTVAADDLVGNVMRSRRLEHQREIDKLGKPIDRGEWFMTPHTVNAYYNPPMNEVVFPAAILQPPFFNVEADDAVNYGGIGAVIGHEFSHGFDDQGRKYDGNGNLNEWWTEADAEAFSVRAKALVDQYARIEVLPGKFLNGEFTLGENIGDLSGLAVAYRAYRMSLQGQQAPVLDGFTGDQRFFIGWAQVWRRLYRDENLEVRIGSDPHSHSEARVNAIVRNFDAWYQAFDVSAEDALYLPPEQRVKIW